MFTESARIPHPVIDTLDLRKPPTCTSEPRPCLLASTTSTASTPPPTSPSTCGSPPPPPKTNCRDAYLTLESKRTDLWTPGHIDSFRRDRFDLDAAYVRRLVRLKQALARHWVITGQVDDLAPVPTHADTRRR